MDRRKPLFGGKLAKGAVMLSLACSGTAQAAPAAQANAAKDANESLKLMQAITGVEKRPGAEEINMRHRLGKSGTTNRPDVSLVACEADEIDYLAAERSVVEPWRAAWQAKDLNAFKALTSASFKASAFADAKLRQTAAAGGVTEYAWSVGEPVANDGAYTSIAGWLGRFDAIDDVALETFEVSAAKSQRNEKTLVPNAMDLLVRFDVRGQAAGERRNDRGMLKATVVRDGQGWKLDRVAVVTADTLTAATTGFTDVTKAAGIAELPSYTRNEAIRRGGYAISTADFDGDGNVDMFVGASGPSQLLKGDGKGGFKPVEGSGLGGETLVKTAVFADFFRTGRQDLLLVRFEPRGTEDLSELVFYKNLGNGQFKRLKNIVSKSDFGHAMPAAVADYNNDGLLDFYVGFPGSRDFTNVFGTPASGPAKIVEGLFMNNGEGFDDATEKALGGKPVDPAVQGVYAHSAVAFDYDQDGDMDIAVIDDRGHRSLLYKNDGKGVFTESSTQAGVTNNQWGMSAAVGDLDGDGVLDLALTDVNVLAARRMNRSCGREYDTSYAKLADRGLRVFKGLPGGQYAEVTEQWGFNWAGEGLAGLEFVDYDNDGDLDVYITNGLWSGTARGQDIGSAFMRGVTRHATDRMSLPKGVTAEQIEQRFGRAGIMRFLKDYKGDVTGTKGLDARPSLAGFQRNRLFRNEGGTRFTEVGYLEGVDSQTDGYIVALADVNNDGRTDMVLRNADPGTTDLKYPTVQVLVNTRAATKGLTVTLSGKVSNGDGIGALVTATVAGKTYTRHLVANNGTAQSQKAVFFGLGDAVKADKLSVRWPSGVTQELSNVPAGTVTVVEKTAGVASR
jgi:hypothetical protein